MAHERDRRPRHPNARLLGRLTIPARVAGASPAVTTMGEVKPEDDATTQSGQDEGDAAPAQPESSASPTSHKPSPAEAFVTRAMGAYASAPTGIAISDFKTENRGHYEALSDDQQATLRQAEAARRVELKRAKA